MVGSALPPKTIWRGNPVSPTHKPDPVEIVRLMENLQALISAGTLGDNWYATKALLNADLTPAANAVAVVYGDTTAANNGTYVKVGATGTGSWTQITNFLPGYQVVQIDDDGSSTANAYTMDATPFAPSEDGAALFFGFVPVTNTATSVTISFDGGSTTYAVKVLDGSNPAIGALVAGMPIIGTITASGVNFRILTDTDSAANLIAAQAAQTATEAARDQTLIYRNDAQAAAVAAAQKFFPVTVVDTSGAAVAADYENGDTIDGVTLATGDFVLRATTGGDPADGVYVVSASGAASRSPQFAAYDDLPGSYFSVQEGSSYADTLWRVTSDKGGTLGVTDIVVERFSGGGLSFNTVADLQADTTPSYPTGQIVTAGGFRYQVAASGASDHHLTNAGGAKFYVLASSSGYNVLAFGAVGDGITDDTDAFNKATLAESRFNDSNFSNNSDLKRTIIIPETASSYRIAGTVYIRKGQHLKGSGLGPVKINVPVTDGPTTFRLGWGKPIDPFPNTPVKTTATAGATTVTLDGHVRDTWGAGGLYNWLKEGPITFSNGVSAEVASVNFTGTDDVITLTSGLTAGVPAGATIQQAVVEDSSGLPPSISDLNTEGGSTTNFVVDGARVAGVTIKNMFITTASRGVRAAGGDCTISGCTFDDAPQGRAIQIVGSRNTITGNHFFLQGFGIDVQPGSYDWIISNNTFAFSPQNDIRFNGGTGDVRNILIANNHFLMNAQTTTNTGAIRIQSGDPDLRVIGNKFSNLYSWAVNQASTGNADVEFKDNMLSQQASNAAYIQGTTMAGLLIGNGRWTVAGNTFKGLNARPIQITQTAANTGVKRISNNEAIDNDASEDFVTFTAAPNKITYIVNNEQTSGTQRVIGGDFSFTAATPDIILDKNNGFWEVLTSGGRKYIKLPSVNAATFMLSVSYNTRTGGSALYRFGGVFAVNKGVLFDSVVKDYVTADNLCDPASVPTHTLPDPLDVQFELDSVGSGNSLAVSTNRFREIIVSIPETGTAEEVFRLV